MPFIKKEQYVDVKVNCGLKSSKEKEQTCKIDLSSDMSTKYLDKKSTELILSRIVDNQKTFKKNKKVSAMIHCNVFDISKKPKCSISTLKNSLQVHQLPQEDINHLYFQFISKRGTNSKKISSFSNWKVSCDIPARSKEIRAPLKRECYLDR